MLHPDRGGCEERLGPARCRGFVITGFKCSLSGPSNTPDCHFWLDLKGPAGLGRKSHHYLWQSNHLSVTGLWVASEVTHLSLNSNSSARQGVYWLNGDKVLLYSTMMVAGGGGWTWMKSAPVMKTHLTSFVIIHPAELTGCNFSRTGERSLPCGRSGWMWIITREIYCDFMPALVKLMISQRNIALLMNNTFGLKYANTRYTDRWRSCCSRLSSDHWCHQCCCSHHCKLDIIKKRCRFLR